MSKLDLSKYGITDVKEILHNPSYEELFKAETDPSLTGYEKGQVTELGAVNVMTGIYTGRSPKDKRLHHKLGKSEYQKHIQQKNTKTTTNLVAKKLGPI